MKLFEANGASLMFDFHRASLEMAWLCLCRITNESTQTENCYFSLNRELRWLWNSVIVEIEPKYNSIKIKFLKIFLIDRY